MRILSPYPRRKARIEIIPLIDIVFFLLATFVMVSLSMVQNKGVQVRLPTAATGASMERKASATISLTDDGSIYLDKQKVSTAVLTAKLKSLKAKEPELTVFINGDEKAYFGKAIEVFDQVRGLGITKVSVQTKNKQ